jgi:signal peptidase I
MLLTAPDTTEDEAGEPTDAPTDERSSVKAIVVGVAVLLALLLVRTFVAEPVRVRSDSMNPTLRSGSVVLIDKLTYVARQPQRGEVVVTRDPRNGESIVKRVVAVAGDSVGVENGALVLNGSPVPEKYIDNRDMEGYFFGPDTVPAGTVFVLGDNRANSVDSRAFGAIAVDDIDGRLLLKLW